jgi:hypothetical protein
MKTDGPL